MATDTILHISDMHIMPHAGDKMLGVDTEYTFHRVLEAAFTRTPKIDLILVTGDLTQDPFEDCYHRIEQKLQTLKTPTLCLPGNHDDEEMMLRVLNAGWVSCRKQVILDNWQIIALNSRIPGEPGGRLKTEELKFLEDCLQEQPDRYALIAVHHHCRPIDSPWLDGMMIENSREFLDILKRYPMVKAVACGHIHQVFDKTVDSIRLFSVPSTCFQFEPESADFSVVQTPPGYRIIQLHQNGMLDTDIYRLAEKLTGIQTHKNPYQDH